MRKPRIPKVSQIVRDGDVITRTGGYADCWRGEERVTVTGLGIGAVIAGREGYSISFANLDDHWRLVLCPETVHKGDRITVARGSRATILETAGTGVILKCSLGLKQWFTWSQVDLWCVMLKRARQKEPRT
jgi:hypothetical protein